MDKVKEVKLRNILEDFLNGNSEDFTIDAIDTLFDISKVEVRIVEDEAIDLTPDFESSYYLHKGSISYRPATWDDLKKGGVLKINA
jgi:hypothetical protein